MDSHSRMLQLLASLLARTPPQRLERIASVGSCLRVPLDRSRRRGHREAAGHLLGRPCAAEESARACRNHLLWALEYLAELGGLRFPVEVVPPEVPPAPLRGRLVVTLHRGQWISGARAWSERTGTIETLAGVQLRRRWQPHIHAFAHAIGVRLHGPGAMRELDLALRAGGTVALHLDGHPDPTRCRTRRSGPPVGVRAAAILAERTGCEVIGAVCDRVAPGRLRLSWTRMNPEGVRQGAKQDVRQDVRQDARQDARQYARDHRRAWEAALHRILLQWVAEDPSAWIVFDPRALGRRPDPFETNARGRFEARELVS